MKNYFYAGLAILLIFLIFLVAREQKEAGRNEIRVEQLEDKNIQNRAIIDNQKKTNEIQRKQQKIIKNLDIPNEYRLKWLRWIHPDITANS
mgnify:CR=1 FL=1|jgi:hypothetical protein|tara:strand:+ start:1144 stop:1416 length:273 start_codon:yes stop_codon:yes gene_type:complete